LEVSDGHLMRIKTFFEFKIDQSLQGNEDLFSVKFDQQSGWERISQIRKGNSCKKSSNDQNHAIH
jgi:hypothetical protein